MKNIFTKKGWIAIISFWIVSIILSIGILIVTANI